MTLLRNTVVLACGALVACGGGAPTRPTDPARAPASPTALLTVTVTDGWTRAPVSGAHITADGIDVLTDAHGVVTLPGANPCPFLTIDAAGFLQRQTCAAASITLWPVANAEEIAATREMAFYSDRLTHPYPAPFTVPSDLEGRSDLQAIWKRASEQLATATRGTISVAIVGVVNHMDDYFVVSAAQLPPACTHGWFTWSFAVAGFCWDTTGDYFGYDVTVDPSLLDRADVVMRAMAYGSGLRPHSQPGLMNRTSPGAELSEFEKKTIFMMAARKDTRWPDIDVH